jgi:hypothetical protein
MPRCPIQADPRTWLPLLLLASCGDAAVPQGNLDAAHPDATAGARDAARGLSDAGPPLDACACRAQAMTSRIGFPVGSREIGDHIGQGHTCDSEYSDGVLSVDGELLGGSAVLEEGPNDYKAWLFEAGIQWFQIFPDGSDEKRAFLSWMAVWRAPVRDDGHRMITTAACLMPAQDDAECTRTAWVSHTVQTATVAPQESIDLRASCADGVLIAGGCASDSFPDFDIAITRAGFAPDNRDQWLCSFTNLHTTITYDVMAQAFCLHEEPLPAECGCCPSLADSLTIKQEPEPLRFGANRLQVQCDPGQLLVLGNCMINTPSAADIADVRIFRSGFPPTVEHPDGDHSTWGCSWYNPTGSTPQAIATAVCLSAE